MYSKFSTWVSSSRPEYTYTYVFVASCAFLLQTNIIKPYARIQEKGPTYVFNYGLSKAWSVTESIFGIISVVFRVLWKPQLLQPEKATKTISPCMYLHTILRSAASQLLYSPPWRYGHWALDSWTVEGRAVWFEIFSYIKKSWKEITNSCSGNVKWK